MRFAAVLLLVLGLLAVVWGALSLTTPDSGADFGPADVQITSEYHVNVPFWAGVIAMATAATILLATGRGARGRKGRHDYEGPPYA